MTASATCPGTPEYRFLVNGTVAGPYGTAGTYRWDTTGKAPGTYQLEVDVRNQGSTLGYEAWSISSFDLTP